MRIDNMPNANVVIISGRSLADIENKVGISKLNYAGNHGLEWKIKGEYGSVKIPLKMTRYFQQLRQTLAGLAERFTGVAVEDKQLSFSLHFRQLRKSDTHNFEEELKVFLKQIDLDLVQLLQGKKVVDFRPNIERDKGDFCQMFIKKFNDELINLGIIYIGDDVTDESAFAKLEDVTTVRVGYQENSKAKYYLENQRDVIKILDLILKLTK